MKIRLSMIALFLSGAFLAASPAWSQVFRCVDDDNRVTYSNDPASAKNKECSRLQLEPETVIPPARVPARTPGAASNPTPVDFPKVTSAEQKAKDNDRRTILSQELANEKTALEKARKDLEEQKAVRLGNEQNYQKTLDRLQPYEEQVAQHERNIAALNKELANLK
jgi:hypothetical protein